MVDSASRRWTGCDVITDRTDRIQLSKTKSGKSSNAREINVWNIFPCSFVIRGAHDSILIYVLIDHSDRSARDSMILGFHGSSTTARKGLGGYNEGWSMVTKLRVKRLGISGLAKLDRKYYFWLLTFYRSNSVATGPVKLLTRGFATKDHAALNSRSPAQQWPAAHKIPKSNLP